MQRRLHSSTQALTGAALEALLSTAEAQRATAPGTRLAAATHQQLQQAGLLQQLPALMTQAAQDLAAAAAAAADPGNFSSSCSAAAGATHSQQLVDRMSNAGHLLNIYHLIVNIQQSIDGAAACLQPAPAVLRLVLAVFETEHKLQQQQQQQQQQQSPAAAGTQDPPESSIQCQAINRAYLVFLSMVQWLRKHVIQGNDQAAEQGTALWAVPVTAAAAAPPGATDPVTDRLLRSLELQRCLALVTCVTLFAIAPSYSTSSNSAGSSSSGGGGSGGVRQHTKARTQAQQQSAAAGGCGFPVSPLTGQLFELLGVEQAALQAAARQLAGAANFQHLWDLVDLRSDMFTLEVSCAALAGAVTEMLPSRPL